MPLPPCSLCVCLQVSRTKLWSHNKPSSVSSPMETTSPGTSGQGSLQSSNPVTSAHTHTHMVCSNAVFLGFCTQHGLATGNVHVVQPMGGQLRHSAWMLTRAHERCLLGCCIILHLYYTNGFGHTSLNVHMYVRIYTTCTVQHIVGISFLMALWISSCMGRTRTVTASSKAGNGLVGAPYCKHSWTWPSR